jgi:hypothetical protein
LLNVGSHEGGEQDAERVDAEVEIATARAQIRASGVRQTAG